MFPSFDTSTNAFPFFGTSAGATISPFAVVDTFLSINTSLSLLVGAGASLSIYANTFLSVSAYTSPSISLSASQFANVSQFTNASLSARFDTSQSTSIFQATSADAFPSATNASIPLIPSCIP